MKLSETFAFRSGRLSLALLLGLPACSSSSEDKPATPPPPVIKPSSADWMSMGYDNHSTYWNQGEKKLSVKNASTLDKAWEIDTTSSQVTGTPVIAAGKVYLPTQGIIALNLEDGVELWRNPAVGATSSLALDGDTLYVHDAGGVVRALNIENGEERWNFPSAEGPGTVGFSSPVVTKDYVIVGGSTLEEIVPPAGGAIFKGFVLAVNRSDGSLAWRKHTVTDPEKGATIWSSVAVDETLGLVYAATGNNHGPPAGTTSDAFLAIPLADGGDYAWTKQILEGDIWMLGVGSPDYDFGANPIVFDLDGKKLVAGGNKGGDFWVLNRESGEILKQINLGPGSASKGGFFISGAWDGKHLIAACNGATSTEPGSEDATAANTAVLYALDPETLDIAWSRQVNGPVLGAISVANGVGLFGKNKTLQAFNAETGEVLKEFETEATIATAPAVSNGFVVFGSGMSWPSGGATAGTKFYALRVQ